VLHRLGGATLIILTEDGENVPGSEPPAAASDRPEDQPAAGGPAPAARPRVARRGPDTGKVLPDVTRDEQDVGWGELPEPDDDERLLREVPPHHGG
jgi:hypothetical protein